MEQESGDKPGSRRQLLEGGFVRFLCRRSRRKGLLGLINMDVAESCMVDFVVVEIPEEGGQFVF